MRTTSNVHVVDTQPLLTPNELKADLPLTDAAADLVYRAREEIRGVLRGRDRRTMVISGPCSIHDPRSALEYAERLLALRRRFEDDLLLVMRVYFEKPRTTVGWKGLINDPHLDGSHDIPTGLRIARTLLMDLAALGMPVATEMLDPISPQYLADLVAWTAIGARTTESQTHREMASGLSMPVGFKNGTDGSLTVAINAMLAAAGSHSFLGIDGDGRVAVVRTTGNPDGHLVLRGGASGPNYAPAQVAAAAAALEKQGVCPLVLIDASHGNSGKNHLAQPSVVESVGEQVAGRSRHVLGVMIESHLADGRQDLKPGMTRGDLKYGVSITDACIDFSTTERVITDFARASRRRRAPAPIAEPEAASGHQGA